MRSFAGLKGRTVSVILVDLDGRFEASSSSWAVDDVLTQLDPVVRF